MLIRYAGAQTAGLQGAANEYQDKASAAVPWADTGSATLNAIRGLTPRQREVLTVMMQGKSNKGICRGFEPGRAYGEKPRYGSSESLGGHRPY